MIYRNSSLFIINAGVFPPRGSTTRPCRKQIARIELQVLRWICRRMESRECIPLDFREQVDKQKHNLCFFCFHFSQGSTFPWRLPWRYRTSRSSHLWEPKDQSQILKPVTRAQGCLCVLWACLRILTYICFMLWWFRPNCLPQCFIARCMNRRRCIDELIALILWGLKGQSPTHCAHQ